LGEDWNEYRVGRNILALCRPGLVIPTRFRPPGTAPCISRSRSARRVDACEAALRAEGGSHRRAGDRSAVGVTEQTVFFRDPDGNLPRRSTPTSDGPLWPLLLAQMGSDPVFRGPVPGRRCRRSNCRNFTILGQDRCWDWIEASTPPVPRAAMDGRSAAPGRATTPEDQGGEGGEKQGGGEPLWRNVCGARVAERPQQ
jgi:hypothetical protein